MKLNYNFKELFKLNVKKDDLDRPNLHITKCCGNCKYFWYRHRNERRGFCKYGHLDKREISRKDPNPAWEPKKVHSTTVCDYHIFRGKNLSIGRISEWIGKKFNLDGSLSDEE